MVGVDSLNRRLDRIEDHQNTPQETYDITVRMILSKLTDAELDIMEIAAKLREKGLSEDDIEKKIGPDQWQEYQSALEHFRQINADLIVGRMYKNGHA